MSDFIKATEYERDYIRNLAIEVSEIAKSYKNKEIIKRWIDVNELRKTDRAPVWCNPIGAWQEIIPSNSLLCKDKFLRGIENNFKILIKKNEINDDTPINPYIKLGAVFDVEPENTWGVRQGRHLPNQKNGAFAYDPPLKENDDFLKLRIPNYTYNDVETQKKHALLNDLLGDILPVKLVGNCPLSATLGTYAADFRGLTEMMMDMAIEPELMHKLMAHLRDGVLSAMEQYEKMGHIFENNDEAMIYSESFGSDIISGNVGYKNLWCMANSQEYDQVSPEMWEEFCLNYQMPILNKFGRVAYGCCENLTNKMEGVLSIPNLRIFVCSAWTNLEKVVNACRDKYVIMWRQKATDVVFADDTKKIQYDLEEGLRKLQGCHYQIVLRELETLNGNNDRLHVWTELAKEAAAKIS